MSFSQYPLISTKLVGFWVKARDKRRLVSVFLKTIGLCVGLTIMLLLVIGLTLDHTNQINHPDKKKNYQQPAESRENEFGSLCACG